MSDSLQNKGFRSPDEHFQELTDLIRLYNNDKEELEFLQRVYQKAFEAHFHQKRKSGEPYINHPLEAAKILARIKMDIYTVAGAILHDTIEDTDVTYEELCEEFGAKVADLVDGVTKLSAISASKKERAREGGKSKLDNQAENLRKIFLAMAKDIRVILIKVADRLHNLRTLGALPPHKQKYIARESMDIFAPIAGRLGMWEFKWQIEDISFSYLEPEVYEELEEQVEKMQMERTNLIKAVSANLRSRLDEIGLDDVQISGRPKHLYSVFKKMKRKERNLDEIYDLLAVRVIVGTERECYQVLGVVHQLWMPFQNRFKDYIAMPKSNNYRSLHTTVYGPHNQPVEVQIRTREMHRVNEYGIAAHWAYKDGSKNIDINMNREIYPWIRRILDWQNESKDAREYIENLKLDLLGSEVFVFTPGGDVIDLPAGSTPIDFAFRIHTEVGYKCVGAKVNSKIVPIDYKLKNADIVEILTKKHSTPSRDWLKIVKSPHARNKIRQWFKKEMKEENIVRGKELILEEQKRNKLEVSFNNTDYFNAIARRYKFVSAEDLYASVGYGETSAMTVVNRLQELIPQEEREVKVPEPSAEAEKKKRKKRRKSKSPVEIKGMGNLLVRYAKCCQPVWGDDVIGYVTLGKGVSIHRVDCPNHSSLIKNPERLVEVSWVKPDKEVFFGVELQIDAFDRPGILADVMNVANELNFPIKSAKAWARGDSAIIKLTVDVTSKKSLESLLQSLRKVKDVVRVFRIAKKSF